MIDFMLTRLKKEDKLWHLKQAVECYPDMSVRKLAEYTGLSKSTVARSVSLNKLYGLALSLLVAKFILVVPF